MKPERARELLEQAVGGSFSACWKLVYEIERLQAPLPEDLKKQLRVIEEFRNDFPTHSFAPDVVDGLTKTIRALQADLQKERERNDEMSEQLGYAAEDGWTDETEKPCKS